MNDVESMDLERIEARYWSSLFIPHQQKNTHVMPINDGIACAFPQLDILAYNRVLGMKNGALSESSIEDIINFFRQAGSKRFFIQLHPDESEDTIDMLKSHEFVDYNQWIKLMLNVSDKQPENTFPSSLSIRPVKREEAYTYGEIITTSFEWPKELIDFFASSIGLSGYHHYFAIYNNTPIAAAALFVDQNVAAMAIAGTLPEYRGMGAQTQLLYHRIHEARRHNCQFMVTETGDDSPEKPNASFRNMCKVGFKLMYKRRNFLYSFDD